MAPKEKETPGGVGPGITGASGDMIEGTGHGQGIGGTGHDDDADAAGMRPQDQYTARPDEQQAGDDAPAGATSSRTSGSSSEAGGGGSNAVQSPVAGNDPGRSGGGGIAAPGDIAGGLRNVTPANDSATDPDHIHEGAGQDRSPRGNHPRAGNPGTDDEH